MRKTLLLAAFACALALAGCNDQKTAEAPPPPQEMTASAIGHYCGMNVVEHPGPKAQIILKSRKQPVWFSSARDAISFTMLPEEPKDIRAIYVSDMAKASNWAEPGTTNWVDAKQASFVIGSRMKGGMGGDEAVPFSDKGAAEKFAAENGGRVVAFADVPKDYVLGATAEMTGAVGENPGLYGQPDGHRGAAAPKDGHAH
ncbi:nitrous oxide reductase accessory protein NosL [Microvirga sp. CF3016]|uniref:nitrous oxide reductase accessory protein NosL n=1 Tax=Microvirga sp. CF3016 TaxID=3110181 RepID=UPI002E79B8AF|nr:nitrous oxide reductase accessory protein NosL [Microvirga sp. CF3016]MEE1609866.1 nitrous oxide reductase accessory protein NosL [Microvirga sp. CF3016]